MQRFKRDVDVLAEHVVFDYDTSRELARRTRARHEEPAHFHGLGNRSPRPRRRIVSTRRADRFTRRYHLNQSNVTFEVLLPDPRGVQHGIIRPPAKRADPEAGYTPTSTDSRTMNSRPGGFVGRTANMYRRNDPTAYRTVGPLRPTDVLSSN